MTKNIGDVCNEKPETSDISAKLGMTKSTKVTEQWVIQDVRAKCGLGNYDDYTILVMTTMGIDTSDAYDQISKEGIAGYVNMRMGEAERRLRHATGQGDESESTMKQAIEILKTLRSIDYRNRTPKDGIPVPQTHEWGYICASENGVPPKPEGAAMPISYFRWNGVPANRINPNGHGPLKGRK